jgi:AmiR/NasT family two-component response regulator
LGAGYACLHGVKPRLLICETDPEVIRTVSAALAAAGFESRLASDPEAAWHGWQQRVVDRLRSERESLIGALRDQRAIGAAVGMLIERHGLTPVAAFEALRRHARNERRSVRKVASDVVDGLVRVQVAND